ncbi:Protein kinase, putative [Hondaea fermentalgiana]|uniref:non-specific serine/threonine protein kinase n=1 Tax=Hondaea fermentalgiana TaxID=2315210 RepID=A0A2R5GCR6_9STRA|nr:Protein kinase, putative [Hondaea fermentalgiana]|eukprot:GBG28762.1 Protein kinase, putative [Hondaea fermentalgiana]
MRSTMRLATRAWAAGSLVCLSLFMSIAAAHASATLSDGSDVLLPLEACKLTNESEAEHACRLGIFRDPEDLSAELVIETVRSYLAAEAPLIIVEEIALLRCSPWEVLEKAASYDLVLAAPCQSASDANLAVLGALQVPVASYSWQAMNIEMPSLFSSMPPWTQHIESFITLTAAAKWTSVGILSAGLSSCEAEHALYFGLQSASIEVNTCTTEAELEVLPHRAIDGVTMLLDAQGTNLSMSEALEWRGSEVHSAVDSTHHLMAPSMRLGQLEASTLVSDGVLLGIAATTVTSDGNNATWALGFTAVVSEARFDWGSIFFEVAFALSGCLIFTILAAGYNRFMLKQQYLMQPTKSWRIMFNELHITKQLGQGATGIVFKAKWHGKDVAVKIFNEEESKSVLVTAFVMEVAVLQELRHPNVVLFMGACFEKPRLCIVTELLKASLYDYIQAIRNKAEAKASGIGMPKRPKAAEDAADFDTVLAGELPWLDRMAILLDACLGMSYLHEMGMLHHDLKSPNLLLGAHNTCKVADFGMISLKPGSKSRKRNLLRKSTEFFDSTMAKPIRRDSGSDRLKSPKQRLSFATSTPSKLFSRSRFGGSFVQRVYRGSDEASSKPESEVLLTQGTWKADVSGRGRESLKGQPHALSEAAMQVPGQDISGSGSSKVSATERGEAPEIIEGGPFTEKADVFSFGVIMAEIASLEQPYKGMAPFEVTIKVVDEGIRPSFGERCPPKVKDLAHRCMLTNPKDRPSLAEVAVELTELQQDWIDSGAPDMLSSKLKSAQFRRRNTKASQQTKKLAEHTDKPWYINYQTTIKYIDLGKPIVEGDYWRVFEARWVGDTYKFQRRTTIGQRNGRLSLTGMITNLGHFGAGQGPPSQGPGHGGASQGMGILGKTIASRLRTHSQAIDENPDVLGHMNKNPSGRQIHALSTQATVGTLILPGRGPSGRNHFGGKRTSSAASPGAGAPSPAHPMSMEDARKEVQVNVLIFDLGARTDLKKVFVTEMDARMQISHKNVVGTCGGWTQPDKVAIVVEAPTMGTLWDFITSRLKQEGNAESEALPVDTRSVILQALSDTAAALGALHSMRPPIVHKNVRASNVSLFKPQTRSSTMRVTNRACTAKLGGFGFDFVHKVFSKSEQKLGSPGWSAPEVLMAEEFLPESDIFAFGVMMWEVLAVKEPFSGLDFTTIARRRCMENVKLETPSLENTMFVDKEEYSVYLQLMEACMNGNPAERPNVEAIRKALTKLLARASQQNSLLRSLTQVEPQSVVVPVQDASSSKKNQGEAGAVEAEAQADTQ